MDETAAHLVDYVFPQVLVRQRVLSFPKRLWYFLQDKRYINMDVLWKARKEQLRRTA
jgi:hypothetical protein